MLIHLGFPFAQKFDKGHEDPCPLSFADKRSTINAVYQGLGPKNSAVAGGRFIKSQEEVEELEHLKIIFCTYFVGFFFLESPALRLRRCLLPHTSDCATWTSCT